MSIHSIKLYQQEVEKIIHYGGTRKETAIRNAFYNLLNEYAKQRGLMLIPEISVRGLKGKTVIPDGTLKDSLRLDWGYWESKDEADNLDEEIEKKFAKGYPKDNILFEDSQTAVLIQQGNEVMRVPMADAEALDRLIREFIAYERPEVANFRQAIELFKQDIPKVTTTIRGIILAEEHTNTHFKETEAKFWELCKESINPEISLDDIREMMVQHILTEDIFNSIFDETQFHRENNIARELELVINTFFKGNIKRVAMGAIQHYYKAINAAAAQIADHHEKQKFLKVVYEIFYKGYNPKAADRLGVVYTPNEIVKFMIESTDYLLQHHFGKALEDEGVDILDPATGTGTFICDIIDYIRKDKLPHKYRHELHANEIAILPYYIANLNIEFTYKQKMDEYAEFTNLCFVDTLENQGFSYAGKQTSLFGVSAENAKRIQEQNKRKISVVIGNPPYNANQMNENDNNKNREYYTNYSKKTGGIDGRIKDTFVKYSTAQKTKVYDMYSRFYRWAMDRVGDDGIICFISNNSFINARTFDGFRQCIQNDFQYAYIIDLGGNIRELSGKDGIFLNENHTIFGQAAAVGIAMMWLVKDSKNKNENSNIKYIHPTDIRATRDEKLAYLQSHSFKNIPFENINPDKNNNWINLTDNDYDSLLPICDKRTKNQNFSEALFTVFQNGVMTDRDEWVYDFCKENLQSKVNFFSATFNRSNSNENALDMDIKWSRDLKVKHAKGIKITYDQSRILKSYYRPFIKLYHYVDNILNDVLPDNLRNSLLHNDDKAITFNGIGSTSDFSPFSVNRLFDRNFYHHIPQCLPIYRYDKSGNRLDNITDWGLKQFQEHYTGEEISKEDIFHYVYAALHFPAYRSKYELNLKRDFPRIPFYEGFRKWANWGKQLMELHIGYENAAPYPLQEITTSDTEKPKAKLKADRDAGTIVLDEATSLHGIPPSAWLYKLGNRSALDWVLDQYKEKKPSDPTIAEKFNTYRFADYKAQVIDLLKRVCTVSVETMKIIEEINLQTIT
jgi:predicted helicase